MAKTAVKSFSRMSAAAKRVAIAEDILKQIKAEKYNIQTGTWLTIDPVEAQSNEEESPVSAKLVQNVLLGGKHTIVMEAPPATCTCCAVGAACASAIRLFNQDSLHGSPEDGYELEEYNDGMLILNKYFPQAQVDLLEAAFETRTDSHHDNASENALESAIGFGQQYSESEARLVAICKNIIKNDGTFKP